MRLGGTRGWYSRIPKAGAPRRGPGGGGGGSQTGGKTGGDYSPHMDATPRGPPVPPTPDILSPLSRRGISDLSVAVPRRALRRRQSHRISKPPPLLVPGGDRPTRRISSSSTSSSSLTCLDLLRPPRFTVDGLPTTRRLLGIKRCLRGPSVAAGSQTFPYKGRHSAWYRREPRLDSTTSNARAGGEFFTHVFTSRRHRAFDAYFTTTDVGRHRAGRSPRLTIVIFRVGHIDRLRPQPPNLKVQPKTISEQCRAALPHGLCKVSDFVSSFINTHDTYCRSVTMKQYVPRVMLRLTIYLSASMILITNNYAY